MPPSVCFCYVLKSECQVAGFSGKGVEVLHRFGFSLGLAVLFGLVPQRKADSFRHNADTLVLAAVFVGPGAGLQMALNLDGLSFVEIFAGKIGVSTPPH